MLKSRHFKSSQIKFNVEGVLKHYVTSQYSKVRSPPYSCVVPLDPRLKLIADEYHLTNIQSKEELSDQYIPFISFQSTQLIIKINKFANHTNCQIVQ